MKIIADTHIWYKIAEGKYNEQKIKYLPLYLTAMNVSELCVSPKLNTAERVKTIKTCRYIKRLKPLYIEYDFFGYVAKTILGKKIRKKLKLSVINNLADDKLSQQKINERIEFRNKTLHLFKDNIDKQQKTAISDVNMKKNASEYNMQWLQAVVGETLAGVEKMTGISIKKYNSDFVIRNNVNLNFFLFVKAKFLQKLTIEKNYQAAKNDFVDLHNMGYVGKDDKYWIEEPKWIKIIKEAGAEHFLYKF